MGDNRIDTIAAYIVPRGAGPEDSAGDAGDAGGRTYYGNAEPEGEVVVVGGAEYAVGGWAAYELDRRRARRKGGGAPAAYPRRTYVTGDDVIESLYRGRESADPLAIAAERYAGALEGLEREQRTPGGAFGGGRDIVVVPAATPAGIRALATGTDPTQLQDAAEDAALAAGAPPPKFPPVPPLPRRTVQVGDAAGLCGLEAASAPHAAAIEKSRAVLAGALDAAAASLEGCCGQQPGN